MCQKPFPARPKKCCFAIRPVATSFTQQTSVALCGHHGHSCVRLLIARSVRGNSDKQHLRTTYKTTRR
jgi:hypothetical protein